MQRINILGFEIDKITMDGLLRDIEDFIKDGKTHTIVLINPYLILEARKHPDYFDFIKKSDIVTPDGFGLLLAAKIMGNSFPERVTGTDLMPLLGKLCMEKQFSLFLLGGEPGIADKAKEIYEQQFPGIKIAGTQNGYFTRDEEPGIVNNIRAKKPDILIVCMGAYKQEMFIERHIREMNVPLCFGNGAALDFIASKVKRAPEWMQNSGLEWLFRLAQEPKRLWKRYLIGNVHFLLLVFREFIRKIINE